MKTLTRIKDYETGTEYYLGEKGDSHVCIVELYSNDTIDWTKYAVSVYDQTAKTTEKQTLSADGVAKFLIPYSHTYTVTMPTISGYPAPATRTYTASELLTTRYVTHSYLTDYEELDIHGLVESSGDDTVAILAGKTITVYEAGTTTAIAAGVFDTEGRCNSINIPYGMSYTIYFPDITDYTHDHVNDTYVAGNITREITVTYYDGSTGLFGIDAQGNHYTYDQAKAAIEAGTLQQSDIIAIGFNNNNLAHANRGDGKTNCGFCIRTATPTIANAKWADETIAFNPNRLPYITSHSQGLLQQLGGEYNSEVIRELGASGNDCGTWTKQSDGTYIAGDDMHVVATRAATNAYAETLTVNEVVKNGFLPSFAQIYYLSLQLTALKAYFTLLGKTAPTITSGFWYTSCQGSETGAVGLNIGEYLCYTKKHSNANVLVCFDL
jgi:phage tail protein X